MAKAPKIEFIASPGEAGGEARTRIVLARKGEDAAKAAEIGDVADRALKALSFKAAKLEIAEIPGPTDAVDRVIVIGLGDEAPGEDLMRRAGGKAATKLPKAGGTVDVTAAGEVLSVEAARAFAEGMLLARYTFDRHKTKKADDEEGTPSEASDDGEIAVRIVVDDASQDPADVAAVTAGVNLARDLTNEPANILGPVEMADRAMELEALGVEVTVLKPDEMKALGMGALLGVAQGSVRPARLAVMRWSGGAQDEAPLAIVGKAVMFDTGGISIKPAGSMEEMKGDMGGGAVVVGLMHALAARKAKANVIGVIGCVENMPDGNAQRPGDVVTAADGQTIEVINTDAEGRLVLADALWYAQEHLKPSAIVDLATLTGAVLVALGSRRAGLFSNNDDLSAKLHEAGEATGDLVWRLPLDEEYDKLIESKFADMKNVGGRYAGSITAAQFLKRFIKNDLPWAHLDIAGTAISAPQTETNTSWASGFGVRLLDRWIRTNHEA